MPPKKSPDLCAQSDRDNALTLQDARLLPSTGSAVDTLPVDVRQDMKRDTPQPPQTEFTLGASARSKMNKALCIYGTDGVTPIIPSLVEDVMIAGIDGKKNA